jgi:hypothetical protein
MSCKKSKEYIDNVYQNHSKVEEKYIPSIQYDDRTGVYYNERSNWYGGKTEDLSQAMSDYIFDSVNFR